MQSRIPGGKCRQKVHDGGPRMALTDILYPPLLFPQIQYADVPSTTFQRYVPEEDIEDLVPENENLLVLQIGETQVEGVEYRLEPFLVRHHGPPAYTYPPVSSTALSQSSSFFASTSATAHAPRDTAIGSPIADTTDGYAKNEEDCDNAVEDTGG